MMFEVELNEPELQSKGFPFLLRQMQALLFFFHKNGPSFSRLAHEAFWVLIQAAKRGMQIYQAFANLLQVPAAG